jgi:4-hydroxymandelate oxidase
VHKDLSVMREYISQGEAAGCGAIVLTVDAPDGCRMCRNKGGKKPFGMLPSEMPLLPRLPGPKNETLEEYYSRNLNPEMCNWNYISKIVESSRRPLILKGILSPADAERARETGASGIIVSNHGGRQLDGAISSLDALDSITRNSDLNSKFEIYLDGGIRNGRDVFKALALGARAVLLGRPILYGLGVAGTAGVLDILSILKGELENTMLLSGCASLKDITRNKLSFSPRNFLRE